jgi:hypothetical protein
MLTSVLVAVGTGDDVPGVGVEEAVGSAPPPGVAVDVGVPCDAVAEGCGV